jgi:hypothetical protein
MTEDEPDEYERGRRDGRRDARNEIILRMAADEMTHTQIARYVLITRQRVSQILADETGAEPANA